MAERKDTVIVTGSSGFIGRALVARLVSTFNVVGFDLSEPKELPPSASFQEIDLTSDGSVAQALAAVRQRHGKRIASVIHLAAYFDLTGEPNRKYEQITVQGTGRLIHALQAFEVEQFIFASSMLAHKPARPGELIDEDRPLESGLPYRASKIATERLLQAQAGSIPTVYLRLAGVMTICAATLSSPTRSRASTNARSRAASIRATSAPVSPIFILMISSMPSRGLSSAERHFLPSYPFCWANPM
jgi:nucleoside-diphosphate-sugar epimerase